MIAVRAILLGLSLAAIAWFGIAVRADRATTRVNDLISHATTIGGPTARAADRQLDRAATLNPDRQVDVLRSEVALHAGRLPQALAAALRAVHAEPQNAANWLVLEVVAFRIRPALARLAQARLHVLVPPVGSHPAHPA